MCSCSAPSAFLWFGNAMTLITLISGIWVGLHPHGTRMTPHQARSSQLHAMLARTLELAQIDLASSRAGRKPSRSPRTRNARINPANFGWKFARRELCGVSYLRHTHAASSKSNASGSNLSLRWKSPTHHNSTGKSTRDTICSAQRAC